MDVTSIPSSFSIDKFLLFFKANLELESKMKNKKLQQNNNFVLPILISGKALELSRQILPPVILVVIDYCE